jgi:hypothetical protein
MTILAETPFSLAVGVSLSSSVTSCIFPGYYFDCIMVKGLSYNPEDYGFETMGRIIFINLPYPSGLINP